MKKVTKQTKTKVEPKTKDETKVTIEKQELSKKHLFRFHISYNIRLAFNIIIFVISFSLCLFFAHKSFEYVNEKVASFTENNTIDYLVYLKDNDFYDTDYLDENMIYVASLIDKIKLDFNYDFGINEKADVNFKYKILADLIISNENGNNYYKKTYTLLSDKTGNIKDSKNYKLNETLELDYDYYNSLANNFKSQYGVDTNSYLRVYLDIDKSTLENAKYKINDPSSSSITIPLSEKAIEIKFDAKDTSVVKNVVSDGEMVFNRNEFIAECILLIISSFFIVKTINLLVKGSKKKSYYDILVSKLLKLNDKAVLKDSGEKVVTLPNGREVIDASRFAYDRDEAIIHPAIELAFELKILEDILEIKDLDKEENSTIIR